MVKLTPEAEITDDAARAEAAYAAMYEAAAHNVAPSIPLGPFACPSTRPSKRA
jgi:hypothetical protein